jgi:hypothetical protein
MHLSLTIHKWKDEVVKSDCELPTGYSPPVGVAGARVIIEDEH